MKKEREKYRVDMYFFGPAKLHNLLLIEEPCLYQSLQLRIVCFCFLGFTTHACFLFA